MINMQILKRTFYLNDRYMDDCLHVCMFNMCNQCLLSPEEGIISLGNVSTGDCTLGHVGAITWTWVLCDSTILCFLSGECSCVCSVLHYLKACLCFEYIDVISVIDFTNCLAFCILCIMPYRLSKCTQLCWNENYFTRFIVPKFMNLHLCHFLLPPCWESWRIKQKQRERKALCATKDFSYQNMPLLHNEDTIKFQLDSLKIKK